MKARQEAKLSMYNTIVALDTTSVNWLAAMTAIPIIATYRAQLLVLVGGIYEIAENTEGSTIPTTNNKDTLRLDMESKAASLAAILFSYARTAGLPDNTDNLILEESVRPWMKKSAYTKLKDNITIVKAREIFNLAVNISPASALVPFGFVLPAGEDVVGTMEKFELALSAYYLVISAPEAAIESRKSYNKRLDKLFDQAEAILKNMDAAIYPTQWITETFDLTDFYSDYKAARTIFDPVTTYTGFKGTVTDAITGLPIQGVRVRAFPYGTLNAPEAFTAEDGTYLLYTPKFKLNPYTVRFVKEGYQQVQVLDRYVQKGQKTTIDIVMIPVEP